MQCQDTYSPVLVKEDRTIALSAYTFPRTAEWLGRCLRAAGELCMQQQKNLKKLKKPLKFSEVDNLQCIICAHVIYFFVSPKFRLL